MVKLNKAAIEAKRWTEVAKWRQAYPELRMSDEALLTVASFPSLKFMDYLTAKTAMGSDEVAFLKEIYNELVWVYGNWMKAQRDSNAERLLADLHNNASEPEYAFTRKFLTDYAEANNLTPDA